MDNCLSLVHSAVKTLLQSISDPLLEISCKCVMWFGFCREGEDEEEQAEEFGNFQLLTDDHAFDSEEVSIDGMK